VSGGNRLHGARLARLPWDRSVCLSTPAGHLLGWVEGRSLAFWLLSLEDGRWMCSPGAVPPAKGGRPVEAMRQA
jgi:hypothetical protein